MDDDDEQQQQQAEQSDEVDEVMGVAGGQGGGLFSQYARASAADESHKPAQPAVVSEATSGRKRKRGADVLREDNKENEPQTRQTRNRGGNRTASTRRKRTVADDDDEWMHDDDSKEQPAQPRDEHIEKKEEVDEEDQPVSFLTGSMPSTVDFPTHFASDPQAHAANVRRFEDRDALSDTTELDSSDTRPSHTTTSSAAIDLSGDSVPSMASASSKGKVKYTPLELQVLESKRKHPDLLLLFEVGYKVQPNYAPHNHLQAPRID